MSFIDEVRALSSNFAKRIDHLDTEEATKQALVLPFIQLLGYSIYDPTEVKPEFTADVGMKKGEKVDYAILQNDSPVVLIECKAYGTTLSGKMVSQLLRYFLTTEARIGILTDGIVYRFFSDLDADNRMDLEHFFEFNMLDSSEAQVTELRRFTKAAFNVDEIVSAARELKYTTKIKRLLTQELDSPSDEFVRFFVKRAYKGVATAKIREQFSVLLQRAFAEFINERVNGDGRAQVDFPGPPASTPQPEPVIDPPQPLTEVDDEKEWQPLPTLKPAKGHPKPTGIRLPDNSCRPVSYWKDLAIEATAWLMERNMLHTGLLPIQRSSRYLVSTEPVHPDGRSFKQQHLIESVYLEKNYSASDHVRNACIIVKRTGQNPTKFAVCFA